MECLVSQIILDGHAAEVLCTVVKNLRDSLLQYPQFLVQCPQYNRYEVCIDFTYLPPSSKMKGVG